MFRTLPLLLTVLSAALVGCSTSHEGATNRLGTVHATVAAPPADVARAAEQVLQDMNIPIISAASTAIDGKVVGESARGKDITITIEREGDRASRVRIRHGAIGDADISVTILQRIEEKLGIARDDDGDADESAESK